MPTYQYSCVECDHFFEQFQSFSDDSLTDCPSCTGRLRKVFNAVGVVFKGSGFYRNDSRATAGAVQVGANGSSNGTSEKSSSESTSGSSSSDSGSSGSSESPSKGSTNGSSPGKGSTTGGSSSKSSTGTPAAAS